MKSTRDRILQTLKNHPRTTINELADSVGINAISVRHHLSSLQAEGLLTAEEERHGVGRPRLVYFLTEKGVEKFPTSYLRLTTRLLDQIKDTLPKPVVERLFAQMADDLTAGQAVKLDGLNIEQKLDFIKTMLIEEGFGVEWEKRGDQYFINEVSCPYYHIGQSHPEVCGVDQAVISKMLSIPAEKINCILRGDSLCTYVIQAPLPVEKIS
ncbi:MAG: winged helix-turn-helix transcriptional regulator [Anaerolineaceae bacterium]|nr:winged helix-turn-helix transcriptional regulator [Anaerolineaceae bacterium]NTV36767.1 winged helix-turn-helix transcriptional regulator [Anaerolineaceae bacterium]